jgi:hypothetical protein
VTALSLLGTTAAYLLPLLTGLTVLGFLERGKTIFRTGEKLAYGFALGAGLVGFYLFYLGIAGIPFTFFTVTLIAWPGVIGAGLLIGKRGPGALLNLSSGFRPLRWRPGQKPLAGLFVLLLAGKLFFTLYHAAFIPTYFDDSAANYNYKPKVFYHTRSIVTDPGNPWFLGGYRPAYPQGVPLFKVWVMTWTGGWSEPAVNILSSLAWIGIGLVGWRAFRDSLPPLPAMAFTYVLLSLPLLVFHAAFAYIDIHCAFFLLSGAVLLRRWFREGDRMLLLAAGLVLAVGLSVKDEMLALTAVGFIPPLVLRHLLRRARLRDWLSNFSVFGGGLLLLNLPWLAVKRLWSLQVGPRADELVFEFHPQAFGYLAGYLFRTGNYNIIWPVFLGTAVLSLPLLRKTDLGYLALSLAGMFAITLWLFTCTPFFEFLKIGTTINRALLMFLPLMVYYLALVYGLLTDPSRREEPGGRRMPKKTTPETI